MSCLIRNKFVFIWKTFRLILNVRKVNGRPIWFQKCRAKHENAIYSCQSPKNLTTNHDLLRLLVKSWLLTQHKPNSILCRGSKKWYFPDKTISAKMLSDLSSPYISLTKKRAAWSWFFVPNTPSNATSIRNTPAAIMPPKQKPSNERAAKIISGWFRFIESCRIAMDDTGATLRVPLFGWVRVWGLEKWDTVTFLHENQKIWLKTSKMKTLNTTVFTSKW